MAGAGQRGEKHALDCVDERVRVVGEHAHLGGAGAGLAEGGVPPGEVALGGEGGDLFRRDPVQVHQAYLYVVRETREGRRVGARQVVRDMEDPGVVQALAQCVGGTTERREDVMVLRPVGAHGLVDLGVGLRG